MHVYVLPSICTLYYFLHRLRIFSCCWPRWLSRHSDTLPAGRPEDRIPVGGEIFRTTLYRSWGPPSLLYKGCRVPLPGIKRPGHGVNFPSPYSSDVKERVELYLYTLTGRSWPVLGRTLPFLYFTVYLHVNTPFLSPCLLVVTCLPTHGRCREMLLCFIPKTHNTR
jgi:hypothetical protein